MERNNQFLEDLRLLLKKYLTEKALAEAMAKVVDGSIETYYSIFLRYIIDPNRINVQFVEDFYTIFQPDLDELRSRDQESIVPAFMKGDSKMKTVFEAIQFQKEAYAKLQENIEVLLQSYHRVLLGYKIGTHLYYQLLAKYEDNLRKFYDQSNDSPD